jgi:hypothetical protein
MTVAAACAGTGAHTKIGMRLCMTDWESNNVNATSHLHGQAREKRTNEQGNTGARCKAQKNNRTQRKERV